MRSRVEGIVLDVLEEFMNEDDIEDEFPQDVRDKIIDFVLDNLDDDGIEAEFLHQLITRIVKRLIEGKWEKLKVDKDFEINTKYPYQIRKRSNRRIVSECINGCGYVNVGLNRKIVQKHRAIAFQWIKNDDPENKAQIDHIDRNKLNNHMSNLRWVTPSENSQNRSNPICQQHEYLNELPPDAELISEYNNHDFDRYYYDIWDERILMIAKSGKIKVVKPYVEGIRSRVQLYDINDKTWKIDYNRFIDYLRHNY